MRNSPQSPGLISVIFLSIGTMVGSGWLFAAYYAAKEAGSAAVYSWIIGGGIALLMALLLARIAVKHPGRNGLFTNLLSLSHNPHFSYVTASSNWILGLIVVPSEAIATTQYIAGLSHNFSLMLFAQNHLTYAGIGLTIFCIGIYTLLNYWGIKLLTKANNSITFLKLAIPALTCITLLATAFHSSNFSVPLQMEHPTNTAHAIFNAVINSGIFYSFYGFQIAVSFASELKNPKRNIPIALFSSVIIVLLIYVFLQIAFIGSVPSHLLSNGWANLNFSSPLAQLSTLLGLNILSIVLYVDAGFSPSGTGLVYLGASSRMLNEMVNDKQVPKCLGHRKNPIEFSRRSLIVTFIASSILVFFFKNWQLIAALTTTFLLISCLALPIGYMRLQREGSEKPSFPLQAVACTIFLILTYLLSLCSIKNLIVVTSLQIVLFVVYGISKKDNAENKSFLKLLGSSCSILIFLLLILGFAVAHPYIRDEWLYYTTLFVASIICFYFMVNQKDYTSPPAMQGKASLAPEITG